MSGDQLFRMSLLSARGISDWIRSATGSNMLEGMTLFGNGSRTTCPFTTRVVRGS